MAFFLLHLHAKGDAMQTNNAATNTIRNDGDILQFIQKVTRDEHAKRFAEPKVVPADNDLLGKLPRIKTLMKELRMSKSKGPQSLQEANTFLQESLSMACLPTKCFEYDGIFYFSGGTSTKLIDDFSSGFAIRKGESKIYTWSPPESKKEDGGEEKGK